MMNRVKQTDGKGFRQRMTNFFRSVMPGLVTGGGDNDPSGIGTYSLAGARYGLAFAWVIILQIPMLFGIQEMCGRIGIVTGQGLATNMKKIFPWPLLYFLIIILSIANIFNIGADLVIMIDCARLLVDHNGLLSALIITFFIVIIEVFIPYRIYSKILFVFSLFLVSYIITAFMVPQNWLYILRVSCIPTLQWNKDFIMMLSALIGTTISPYLFFWQTSQSVEECSDNQYKDHKKAIKSCIVGTLVGMIFSQVIAFFIIVTTYSTLNLKNINNIESAYDAALALKPLAGEFAVIIFSIGVIGAGLLGISVLAGSTAYALAEIFKKKEGLSYTFYQAPFFYTIIGISVMCGLGIYCMNMNSIQVLFYAALINCIISAPLLAGALIVANTKSIMGQYCSSFFSNTICIATLVIIVVLSVMSLGYTFIS